MQKPDRGSENPGDVRNIGAVIRNVNALGTDKAYIVDPHRILPADWQDMRLHTELSKKSVSPIKWSFVKRFESSEECLAHLKKNHFSSIVTSPHLKGRLNVVLHEGDYTIYTKLAVWFGNEAREISDLAVEQSEVCANIPMYGMIESLNLGTTSGIVLYEIARQRRAYLSKYKRAGKRQPVASH